MLFKLFYIVSKHPGDGRIRKSVSDEAKQIKFIVNYQLADINIYVSVLFAFPISTLAATKTSHDKQCPLQKHDDIEQHFINVTF